MQIQQELNDATYQIQKYQPGKIWIGEQCLYNSFIVQADKVFTPWHVQSCSDLTEDSFAMLNLQELEIIIIGTGEDLQIPSHRILKFLHQQQVGVEYMTNRGACYTYNMLCSDNRRVAACFILT